MEDVSVPAGSPVSAGSDAPTRTVAAEEMQRRVSGRGESAATTAGAPLVTGAQLDRYVIIDQVGEGGMGTVYRAYDPELDRRVAIKVVRADHHTPESRQRILREAQSLARLSHPNVIPVHDAGTAGGQVYLVMEFVDGCNLRDWLRTQKRSDADIARMFLAAGYGLAAAHGAGLVHRDFKPHNVLVGDDGRVRVLDFGLARGEGKEDKNEAPGPARESAALRLASVHTGRVVDTVTRAGSLVGTPAYMAPEQLLGEAATAASDQFSFAVSLFEALAGERPYADDNLFVLLRSMQERKVAPSARQLPGWAKKVIDRALSPAPEARYPDMDSLLEALSGKRRRRRRRAALVTAAATVLLAAGGAAAMQPAATPPCSGEGDPLADTWNDDVRQTIRTRLGDGGATDKVIAALSEHASAWRDARQDSCEATHVRNDQSGELFDLRVACFDRRRAELGALTSLLAEPERGVTAFDALQAAQSLPSVQLCDGGSDLRLTVPPPQGAEAQAQQHDIEVAVAEGTALFMMGDMQRASDTLEDAVDRARKLGYAPLQAEALFALGMLEARYEAPDQAVETLYEAQWLAESVGLDRVIADARIWAMYPVGSKLGRPAEAEQLAQGARAVLERMGGDPELEARYNDHLGSVRNGIERRLVEALELYRKGLALNERVWGSHLKVGLSAANAAITLTSLGRFAEARQMFARSTHELATNAGPDNDYLAEVLLQEAYLELLAGELPRARRIIGRVELMLGRLNPGLPASAHGWPAPLLREQKALLAAHEGRPDEARAGMRATRESLISMAGPDSRIAASAWAVSGELFGVTGDHEEAAGAYDQAAAIYARVLGADNPWTSETQARAAEHRIRAGQAKRGRAELGAAIDRLRRSPGVEDALARPLLVLAESSARSGDLVTARAAHKEAVDHWDGRQDLDALRQRVEGMLR